MADCMQFLSENHLNGCQIFGRFGFLKTESELNFGFPHIPQITKLKQKDTNGQAGADKLNAECTVVKQHM